MRLEAGVRIVGTRNRIRGGGGCCRHECRWNLGIGGWCRCLRLRSGLTLETDSGSGLEIVVVGREKWE